MIGIDVRALLGALIFQMKLNKHLLKFPTSFHSRFIRMASHFSWSLTVAMAGVIRLFPTIKKIYKTMGLPIRTSQSCWSEYFIVNAKILFFSISTVQLFLTSSAYVLFEAKTADEHGISFFIVITIFAVAACIVTTAWKIDKILTLIGKYEEFIEKS